MAFKLQEFISSINTDGVARTHSYEVIITPPTGLGALATNAQRLLTLRCQEVDLPEIDFQVTQYYKKVIGPGERRVTGMSQYKIIPMQFIVDGDLKIREFFENWMQYIVNYGDSGNYSTLNSDQFPYEVAYKNEYVGTVTIKVYPTGLKTGDSSEQSNKVYTLYNAYPINMGNVQLRWSNFDQNMTLPIGFTYDKISVSNMLSYMNSTSNR